MARALLAAVGRLDSAEHLPEDAPLLHRPARVGVSLSPPDGRAVPRWLPLRAQYQVVHTVFQAVVPAGLPITLMQAYVPLSEPGAHYAETLLKEAEVRIVQG